MKMRPLFCLFWLIAGLPTACDGAGLVGGECRTGLVDCNGECVNVALDRNHCGSCQNSCEGDSSCQQGVCNCELDAGRVLCANSCSDPQTDSTNCGSCGNSCSAGLRCDVGVCVPGTDSSIDSSLDNNVPESGLPDVVDSSLNDGGDGGQNEGGGGTAGGTGGTAGAGGAGGAGGTGSDPCFPPYVTAARCGDCSTSCSGAAPFCAPSDGGFGCVSACSGDLQPCGEQCVDTTSDGAHCGSCGRGCPTSLCQASQCVGREPGHVVVMCMNYEQVFQTTPQTKLFGNSIFLNSRTEVRVLEYRPHTPDSYVNGVRRTIAWAELTEGRTTTFVVAGSEAEVTATLTLTNYDVFLVHDQPNAPSGELGISGAAWQSALSDFTVEGGIVIVLASENGTAEMHELITQAGLLNTTGVVEETFTPVVNVAPGNSVGNGVLSPFMAYTDTCSFVTSDVSSGNLSFIVTDGLIGDAGGLVSGGNPVVTHLIVSP
ncbi:MAG: hypothetical protein HRU17_10550 [Polyangiaceae bacterium]|nr:hypothetical protein [Polyangiaceae bacterium]